MPNPTLSASLSKPQFVPGERMVLTVVYGDADNATETITITGTDTAGNAAVVTLSRTTADPVTLSVVDSAGKSWTKDSDDGRTAVFSAIA